MNYIYIGKYVNTHGIKGEIKIISSFNYKELIFKKGFKLYIGNDKKEMVITSYRVHKNYDMLTFEGIYNINQIIDYKGSNIYIDRSSIKIDNYFDEDYIDLAVYSDRYLGKVIDILKNKNQDLLVIKKGDVINYVPKINEFINKVDLENKKIYINEIEGLINEN